MPTSGASRAPLARSEPRDYYEVLGVEPRASAAELRAAFRAAVLRHHPDRSPDSVVANRRTSALNRAWAELRDPLRRLHYDRALEAGRATTLDWPLGEGEVPSGRPRRRARSGAPTLEPSPWHQPQWRSVAGFRVPAGVFLAGPAAQRRWIVQQHIAGEDWRDHNERYWLRFAAEHYRERGRLDDWIGTVERLMELEPDFDGIVRASPREAYIAAGEELRGAAAISAIGERYQAGTTQRRWAEREVRALLLAFRDQRVRRGRPAARAEHAELLLNFMESLGIEPSFGDVRAAILAHRRAGNRERAGELVERAAAAPIEEPGRWFSLVQLLTEAGDVERASALLAAIARGDHPEALDPRRVAGQPLRRIAAARRRLVRAMERARSSPAPARRGRAAG